MNDLLLDGAYNENDYSNLCVSDEVKYVFKYISRYRPVHPNLDTRFKPFIQDYIPAVGDIDAFIKLPRPDGNEELLGKTNLDEPAAKVEQKLQSTKGTRFLKLKAYYYQYKCTIL